MTLVFSLLLNTLYLILPGFVYAASSPWTQTDWSGGSGQTSWSDTTKFSSSSNVTTSTAGQVTLTATSSWYNTSWAYRRKITFDNSSQAENLTNFPVQVKLSSSNINYSNTQDSGQDIRFTDSDGTTLLSHEIEKWDETGNSFVWVKVPQIDASSSTDNIYMYYGNTSAADAQAATSVWDSNYVGVWHLKESGNGTAGEYKDSTSNANNGQGGAGTSTKVPSLTSSGQVDGAQTFDGTDDYISVPDNTNLNFAGTASHTISFWINSGAFDATFPFALNKMASNRAGWQILRNNTQNLFAYERRDSTGTFITSRSISFTPNEWTYMVWTYNGTNFTGYKNGSLVNTTTTTTAMGETTDPLEMGSVNPFGASNSLDAIMDNIRISNTARSAAWIAASYKSEVDTFNTFASEEPQVQTSGTLTSSIFDTGEASNWGTASWTATTPSNTSASVKVRTSNDSGMSGASDFSSCTALTSGSDISNNPCITDTHRYIQYQLTLSNTDAISTPTFQDITINFSEGIPPASFDLDSPGGNSYTSNERPTFKWKGTTDAGTAGLSKYVLEIDNGDTNDFSINDIPISRTSDLDANKYYIKYENFSDSDSTNNYISVYTKSSSEWASDTKTGENDGRLKEGKRTWKVKAVDSAGNETIGSKTLFVDRTNPNFEFTQVNNTVIPAQAGIQTGSPIRSGMTTTSKTPSIFGKITDTLSGEDSGQSQNDDGPKVASAPKSIEVKLEKKNALGEYELHTLSTLNLTESYFTSSNSKITDNSKQTSDKYSPFEFIPKEDLTLGTYRVTITGKDNAGNTSSSTSLTLNITTLERITTPEEKKIIEKEIEEFKEESQDKIKEELEITKPTETVPPPSALEKTGENVSAFTSEVVLRLRHTSKVVLETIGNGVKFVFNGIGGGLAFVGNTIGSGIAFVGNSIGNGYNAIANNAPGFTKDILLTIGNNVNNTVNGTKNGIANIAFNIGEKADGLSNSVSVVIVKFGYLFSTEPSKISDVKVLVLSPTSAKISWKTNHPANGKVNYGLDETYPLDIQTDKRTTYHEFTLKNLTPNTEYHFEVMSQNKNYVYDANRRFKTPGN